jgi:hypothetical protein
VFGASHAAIVAIRMIEAVFLAIGGLLASKFGSELRHIFNQRRENVAFRRRGLNQTPQILPMGYNGVTS